MAKEIIIVHGNDTLSGTVSISGAKNSALKLMAASILSQGECVIRNVPLISDIDVMSDVLVELGAHVDRNGHDGRDQHTLTIDTSTVDSFETPYELVSKMRASISVLGPLIGRFGQALVAMPGGCQIGARKIDMHLRGLQALGEAQSVILLGGEYSPRTDSVVGAFAESMLGAMFFDIAFIGASGFSLEGGITTPDFRESPKKQILCKNSRTAYFLMDGSKAGVRTLSKAVELADANLITDRENELLGEFASYHIAL